MVGFRGSTSALEDGVGWICKGAPMGSTRLSLQHSGNFSVRSGLAVDI